MQLPERLRAKLLSQWQQPALRTERLLSNSAWPITLQIGRPTRTQIEHESDAVRGFIRAWRQVSEGTVIWQPQAYRGLAQPLDLPLLWQLEQPSQWLQATQDASAVAEFSLLEQVLAGALPLFREPLIRKRHLWRGKPAIEVQQCLRLAQLLEPGQAQGRPLRALADQAVDTKFFARNERLLVSLLDARFDDTVSDQGLAAFLGASAESDHWLLVVPLTDGLLPFPRCRLSTQQLQHIELPGERILLVENEQCEHLLPRMADTLAILGAGRNLQWLSAPSLAQKQLLYWGDIDTWGLHILASARLLRPDIISLLMDATTFARYQLKNAVPEPVLASEAAPNGLTEAEQAFYRELVRKDKGRLEQEFITANDVATAIAAVVTKNSLAYE